MNKEIEISPRQIAKAIEQLLDENEKLNSVINEVREYINKLGTQDGMLKDYKIDRNIKNDLLEILSKVNKESE